MNNKFLAFFVIAALALQTQLLAQLADEDEVILAPHHIIIDKVLYAEDKIEAGKTQLIQVTLGNKKNKKETVKVRIKVIDPSGSSTFLPEQTVKMIGKGLEPVLFRFPTIPDLQGVYKVDAYAYDPRTQKLIAKAPSDSNSTFDSQIRGGDLTAEGFDEEGNKITPSDETASRTNNKTQPASQLRLENLRGKLTELSNFNGSESGREGRSEETSIGVSDPVQANPRSDLSWANLKVLNNSLIRGESTTANVYLVNNGQLIAENVSYRIYMTSEFLKKNYGSTEPIFSGAYSFIAPGETKQIQIPIDTLPTRASGKYIVTGVIDPENQIEEYDENDNIAHSNLIDISEIALINPEENITVSQNALVTFSWRSNLYNLFYVEVSKDLKFDDTKKILRLPAGEPTPLTSLSALKNEMSLLRSLALEDKNSTFFWRVIGFDSANNSVKSNPRQIFIEYQ